MEGELKTIIEPYLPFLWLLPVIMLGIFIFLVKKVYKEEAEKAVKRGCLETKSDDELIDAMDEFLEIDVKKRIENDWKYYQNIMFQIAHRAYKKKRGKFYWQLVAERKKENGKAGTVKKNN